MGDESKAVVADDINEPQKVELMPVPKYEIERTDVDYEKALARLDKQRIFIEKAREIAIKTTYDSDWVVRKAKDGKESASLMGSGAERMISLIGIEFFNIKCYKEKKEDKAGEFYIWFYDAEVGIKGAGYKLPVMGSCDSRDALFSAQQGGGQKPSSEVDEQNVKKSALTNLFVNGATRILGLRAIPIAEIEKAGRKKEGMTTIEYESKKPQERTEDGKMVIDEIKDKIWEMSRHNKVASEDMLEDYTGFTNKEGKVIKGKRATKDISEKQAFAIIAKVRADYENFQKEGGR
jgi:hypothetical protein